MMIGLHSHAQAELRKCEDEVVELDPTYTAIATVNDPPPQQVRAFGRVSRAAAVVQGWAAQDGRLYIVVPTHAVGLHL
jgi:hypothetical protein